MVSDINNVASLMENYQRDQAICGGWAIDLFLGKVTREHKDIDLFIWRKDQLYAQRYFLRRGWKLQVAYGGELRKWEKDDFLELPKHGIWCKHETHQPDFVELLLNDCNETHFLFRRDKSIRLPLEQVILQSDSGIPYLAPEIVLLYKSNNTEDEGNQHDFEVCFPELAKNQQQWLMDNLRKLYAGRNKWLE